MPVTSRKQAEKKGTVERRSICPVACSLDIFGDRWTLLIVRDLLFGRARFKDFTASPEGIPTNILADRLERLLANGVIEQMPAEDGAKRQAYRLTEKGRSLGPILKAIRHWGLTWDKSTRDLVATVPFPAAKKS
ncbi:MAG TPA: helix-turn-helix domain-containing protein [Pseudomonadales bacterium]|nr:helix-turn-helix domain-containing protein [Pseudomonadales bacterium]